MLIRLKQWARGSTASALFAAIVVVLAAPIVSAQEQPQSFLADTFKKAILDPTTYAPAAIAYDATMRDWSSSQPFFRNGYRERNERYTISGRPNDIPMSYADGRQQILKDAVLNLQVSLINNVASRTFERALIDRYPHRRKLVRTIGWVQRIGLASFLSYRLSAAHYRQAAENERRAAQLGYR
jgi:hypothetical protein